MRASTASPNGTAPTGGSLLLAVSADDRAWAAGSRHASANAQPRDPERMRNLILRLNGNIPRSRDKQAAGILTGGCFFTISGWFQIVTSRGLIGLESGCISAQAASNS